VQYSPRCRCVSGHTAGLKKVLVFDHDRDEKPEGISLEQSLTVAKKFFCQKKKVAI